MGYNKIRMAMYAMGFSIPRLARAMKLKGVKTSSHRVERILRGEVKSVKPEEVKTMAQLLELDRAEVEAALAVEFAGTMRARAAGGEDGRSTAGRGRAGGAA